MNLDILKDDAKTEVGSYFVTNYPPYSAWKSEHIPAAEAVLNAQPSARPDSNGSAAPLGLYLHIPFCRKRCKFCYYRVYTGKNSSDVERYLAALAKEIELYAQEACFQGREFDFVYFGGGTPSFISAEQLHRLIERINEHWSWSNAREVTFECEPGTLRKKKLQAIRDIGVTRLSIGIEHFDDEILESNGRAHQSPEIIRAYEWAREIGFDQINLDLIAGMVGDTDAKWKATVEKTLEMEPDFLTIYQMELPQNTEYSRQAKGSGGTSPVADWATKRGWINYAFELFESAGYVVSSANTIVKAVKDSDFYYRSALWRGADMVGTGVASFSHVSGVHYQNADSWEGYLGPIENGSLPLSRALPTTDHQALIRELILQLKEGQLDAAYFDKKFGVDILQEFKQEFGSLEEEGFALLRDGGVELTRAGMLCVDGLLPRFFEPQFREMQ